MTSTIKVRLIVAHKAESPTTHSRESRRLNLTKSPATGGTTIRFTLVDSQGWVVLEFDSVATRTKWINTLYSVTDEIRDQAARQKQHAEAENARKKSETSAHQRSALYVSYRLARSTVFPDSLANSSHRVRRHHRNASNASARAVHGGETSSSSDPPEAADGTTTGSRPRSSSTTSSSNRAPLFSIPSFASLLHAPSLLPHTERAGEERGDDDDDEALQKSSSSAPSSPRGAFNRISSVLFSRTSVDKDRTAAAVAAAVNNNKQVTWRNTAPESELVAALRQACEIETGLRIAADQRVAELEAEVALLRQQLAALGAPRPASSEPEAVTATTASQLNS